jgi:hypothetical protein
VTAHGGAAAPGPDPVGTAAGKQSAREEGGDPVCWAERVCPACGRLADENPPTRCAACGGLIDPA